MADGQRLSQFEKALLGLRSLVMGGAFEPDTRLPEVQLAERLGLSRTPLRQAMDRLVAEGLLERIATGGCKVARFTFDDINDAIELRGVIEGTAVRFAAERGAAPELIEVAEDILAGIDRALADPAAVDFGAYLSLNAEFHELLSAMSGSDIVMREVARVSLLPLASPSAFLQEQELIPDFIASLVRAQGQHRAILEAVRNREGARAEALAREHARLARSNFAYLSRAEPSVTRKIPGLSLIAPA